MSPRRTRSREGAAASQRTRRSDRMLEVLRQFRVVIRSVKRHYQWVEKRCGVSGAQLWAMERVAFSPGITVGELAGELAIHPSTASNLLDRLEALRLVERRRRSADQRRVQLFLTPKGEATLLKAPRPLRGVLQQALSELPSGSLAALQQRLEELLALMRLRDEAAKARPLSDI